MIGRKRPSRGVIAFAVCNLALGLLLLGVTLLALSLAGQAAPEDVAADLPQVPEGVRTLSGVLNGMNLVAVGLLGVGGVGLLRLRNWGRIASLLYVPLSLVSNITSMVVYIVVGYPLMHEQLVRVSEEMAQRGDAQEVPVESLATLLTVAGICCGFPFIIHAVVLLVFLTRPEISRQFRSGEDLGVSPLEDWDKRS